MQAGSKQLDRLRLRALSPALALRVAEGLALALLAWACARLVWAIVTPLTPLGEWQPPAAAPVDRSVIGSFDPFFRSAGGDDTAAVSSLGLTLLGTRVDTVSGRGAAIIATSDGVQASYAVGERIAPGVVLRSVAFDAVTLERDGVPEKLFLDQSAGGTPVTPAIAAGTGPAPRPTLRLAADVLITPRLKGTAIAGYVLMPKGSGAAFAAAGLQPGDVLVGIDGAPVTSLPDPATLARKLDAGGVEVTISRGEQVLKLRIGGAQP